MSQAMVAIMNVELNKKIVNTGEQFMISVGILELTPDSGKRLPFRLGDGFKFVQLPEIVYKKLPIRLGEKGDFIS